MPLYTPNKSLEQDKLDMYDAYLGYSGDDKFAYMECFLYESRNKRGMLIMDRRDGNTIVL
jgi:hypothetical protein